MGSIYDQIRDSVSSLIDSGAHINAANAAQRIGKELGLSDRLVSYTHIELRNKLNEAKFKRVPFKDRMLFLPHCLKKPKGCKARPGEEGIECRKTAACKNCPVEIMRNEAKKLGYGHVFIVPGGSMLAKLAEKYKPKAVLGLACKDEVNLGFSKMAEYGVPAQGVMLLKDGCKDTEANLEEVKEKMVLNGTD